MKFKKKLITYCCIAAVLMLIYTGTFIFDSRQKNQNRSAYTWIRREHLDMANRIEITGIYDTVILEKRGGIWVLPLSLEENGSRRTIELPVKQTRVNDFLSVLSQRGDYPIRSASASAMHRLGLDENRASRITVRGGAGLPLLDLFIGYGDAAGSTIYFRRSGSFEARAGEDIFSFYTESERKDWYNLRLFETIMPDMVQRVIFYPPGVNEYHLLDRSGMDWIFSLAGRLPADDFSVLADRSASLGWLRNLTTMEAEGFEYFTQNDEHFITQGMLVLELGDGTSVTVRIGAENDDRTRPIAMSNSDHVYSLSAQNINRLFPGEAYFIPVP